MLDQGTKLTQLLSDVFTELPEVMSRLDADARTLANLIQQRAKRRQSEAEWAKEISYSAQIGSFSKHVFAISPSGIAWKNDLLPLKSGTRVR